MSGYGKTLAKSDSVAKISSLRRHGDLGRDGRERLLVEQDSVQNRRGERTRTGKPGSGRINLEGSDALERANVGSACLIVNPTPFLMGERAIFLGDLRSHGGTES
jgi:hypothetical protein